MMVVAIIRFFLPFNGWGQAYQLSFMICKQLFLVVHLLQCIVCLEYLIFFLAANQKREKIKLE